MNIRAQTFMNTTPKKTRRMFCGCIWGEALPSPQPPLQPFLRLTSCAETLIFWKLKVFLHERKACSFQQLPSKAFHLQSFLSVLTRMFYSNSCQVKALYVRSFRSVAKTRQANHVASPANASGATMCASATTLPIGEPRAPTVYSIHIFFIIHVFAYYTYICS